MHISYFKVCHLQARTLKDAGRPQSTDTIPQTSREILHTFGRRSMVEGLTIWESIMHTCLPYLPYGTLQVCLGSTYQFMYFNIPPWASIYKLYICIHTLYTNVLLLMTHSYSITYSPTYLLTYLLTYSPTHLLTYALTYLLMLSVVRFKRVGGSASAHQSARPPW